MELDELVIEPGQVLGVLMEKTEATPEIIAQWVARANYEFQNDKRTDMSALITCEGVGVAIIECLIETEAPPMVTTWSLMAVHCIDPRHGTHPRFKDLYARLHEKMAKPGTDEVCPRCNGAEWLLAKRPEGTKAIMMAAVVKMYRGIRLEEDGYQPEDIDKGPLFDSIMKFLREAKTEGFFREEQADGEKKS